MHPGHVRVVEIGRVEEHHHDDAGEDRRVDAALALAGEERRQVLVDYGSWFAPVSGSRSAVSLQLIVVPYPSVSAYVGALRACVVCSKA